MSLRDWLDKGRLRAHKPSRQEMEQLFAVFERDIRDARAENLSADRRFATAYNAALAASGYRASGEGGHCVTIQSLAFTLQPDSRTIAKFNKFRQKRNISDYEMIGMVSEQEVSEMVALAQELQEALVGWLGENHPGLI